MWNYRIVRKKHLSVDSANKKEKVYYTYAIHEAYYDSSGYVGAITQDPIEPFGENVEELRHSWVMMAEAFGMPILDFDDIPEIGYERYEDPVASVLDERIKEMDSGDAKGIPWEQVKRDMEEKFGPFNEEEYQKQVEEERVEKEKIHSETFVGTPTSEGLINIICSDYREFIKRDRTENAWKYKAGNAEPGTSAAAKKPRR
ncbi:MAG: addiction module protein [Desulfohalobiaceae bacterium]|nr:addiction module protein [Desulfohalobiaceae bacterium]